MDVARKAQLKTTAIDIIKCFRVSDLQAVLDYARLSRQGNKRDLVQRCSNFISSNISEQLFNKINQVNSARISSNRTNHSSIHRVSLPPSTSSNYTNVSASIQSIDILPSATQIQYTPLPFYDHLRIIECINIPVDKISFPRLRFILTESDMNLIVRGTTKILVRIVPTLIPDEQNDVLPPYLSLHCNDHVVIKNDVSKTVGAQAHSVSFPCDITDKIFSKSNVQNFLDYIWLQAPNSMSFKNLPKSYTLAIQLVRCVPIEILFNNIVKRQCSLSNNNNNNNNENSDIEIEIEDVGLMTTTHRVSLICPITQSLIVVPAKSKYCTHLTCFDLRSFLQMNEKRLLWTCPICKKSASYDILCVDKRLQSVLASVPLNCSTVEIDTSQKDLSACRYILDNVKEEKLDTHFSNSNKIEQESVHISPDKTRRLSNSSDCIVLSSGNNSENDDNDDDEDQLTDNNHEPMSLTQLPADFFNQIVNNNLERNLLGSSINDGSYWNDLAKLAYNLLSEDNEEVTSRKRTNSSTSSTEANTNDDRPRKRTKQSETSSNDIELITLSSNETSDTDDPLF